MYEIYAKYSNSRLVNYNRWSEAQEVNTLTSDLVAKMKANLNIKKVLPYKFNMKTLLMELYHSYLTDKEQYIAYHRKMASYCFKVKVTDTPTADRYNQNPHITYTCFVGCIDYLASTGYIENKQGGLFRDEEDGAFGYLSRMRATEQLASLWEEYKFAPPMISRFKPEETIILRAKEEEKEYVFKDKKVKKKLKQPIPDYRDTPTVVKMRKVVDDYNRLLERSHIDVDVDCMSQADKEEILDRLLRAKNKTKYTINLSSKHVYRVFNNGSFKQGGRFYGAWWIGCPSTIRNYITIDGESTCELDYSGIHINLLYAFKGLNFPDLNTDAYELFDNDPDRDLNKLILLTAYNAGTAQETAKAVFKSTRDDGTKQRYRLKKHQQVIDKLELLKQKHKPIECYIAQGYGSTLQYHDSVVIAALIEHYTKLNIPILTVHDSVVCQLKYKDFVLNTMKAMFSNYINARFKCKSVYHDKHPQSKHLFKQNQLDARYKPKPLPSYNTVLEQTLNYSCTIPVEADSIIKVKADTSKLKCSGTCNYASRLARIRANKRIFLGKIKIGYITDAGVIQLNISQ